MSEYQCHVCGESFTSDWKTHLEPKYCPDCRAFPESGKAMVYGLRANGGPIRYVGHTTNPVHRIMIHRCPNKYEDAMPALAEWVRGVGTDNVCMEIIRIVDASKGRRYEEIEIRKRRNLLNVRAAKRKIYTTEQAHVIIDTWLDS